MSDPTGKESLQVPAPADYVAWLRNLSTRSPGWRAKGGTVDGRYADDLAAALLALREADRGCGKALTHFDCGERLGIAPRLCTDCAVARQRAVNLLTATPGGQET